MPSNPTQDGWIERVLRVTVPRDGAGSATTPPLMIEWQGAKEAVDQRIEALARELRSLDDPEMERIADFGLFGITAKETVGLNVALLEFDRAPQQSKAPAAGKLRASIKAYRKAVDASRMVDLLDAAPFSTRVELRSTMYSALARIERALAPIA